MQQLSYSERMLRQTKLMELMMKRLGVNAAFAAERMGVRSGMRHTRNASSVATCSNAALGSRAASRCQVQQTSVLSSDSFRTALRRS
jgi:hypothetical protein